VKLLAEPTLITMTGRPATFLSGGSFPILVPSGLGTVSVEFREYGTRVDFVPIVVGNGNIRLQVRPSVSDIDESRGVDLNGTKVPGLTQRHTDTEVEMRAGQTVALAGLIQNRVEGQNKGIPLLADLPWVGRAFSRVEEKVNEVELLIIVTPELVGPLEAHQVPQCGPGQLTTSPSDCELYGNGYLEVPNCCLQGKAKNCRNCPPGAAGPAAAETSAPPGASGQDPTTEAIPTKAKAAEPPRSRNHEAQRRKNSGTMWSMSPGTPAPASPIVPSASATPVSVTPAAPNYRSPAPATHASTSPQAAPAGAPQFIGPLGYDPLR
jgi:pilus assembly protein CpaC